MYSTRQRGYNLGTDSQAVPDITRPQATARLSKARYIVLSHACFSPTPRLLPGLRDGPVPLVAVLCSF
jgi:hypothetical protein